ncbi:MAG TPA: hypothetical protein ENJ09_07680 [Planctomycetes bacterium]|nr:hypothetical protein [Planctomycetota bacterium]
MGKKETRAFEDHDIAGHAVCVVRLGDKERILIDGQPARFRRTKGGYVLSANAYVEPSKTLLDAVRQYLER